MVTSLVVVVASNMLLVVMVAGSLEDVVLLASGEASLPTAGGPSVSPFRADTACLIFNADSPERLLMLKRSE